MILWLLLTACFVFLVDVDPHTKELRDRLRKRSRFFRMMTTCPACPFGWGAAAAEILVRTGAFVPGWLRDSLPWFVSDAIGPVLASAAGVGLGCLVMYLSPFAAMAAAASRRERNGS